MSILFLLVILFSLFLLLGGDKKTLKAYVISLGIAIFSAGFVYLGVDTFYEEPSYYQTLMPTVCQENYNCEQLIERCPVPMGSAEDKQQALSNSTCTDKNYIDFENCKKKQEDCQNKNWELLPQMAFYRNLLWILLAGGVLLVVIGVLLKNRVVGSGLFVGGLMLLIFDAMRTFQYWTHWNNYVKWFILGIVLITLIVVGYKKIEKINNK